VSARAIIVSEAVLRDLNEATRQRLADSL